MAHMSAIQQVFNRYGCWRCEWSLDEAGKMCKERHNCFLHNVVLQEVG